MIDDGPRSGAARLRRSLTGIAVYMTALVAAVSGSSAVLAAPAHAYQYEGPAFVQAPPVFGSDGPPRPLRWVVPPVRTDQAATPESYRRRQDRALLYGPFPRAPMTRGVSDGEVMLSGDPGLRALDLARARSAGAAIVRIPVVWSGLVSAQPSAGADLTNPADPAYDFQSLDDAVRGAVASGLTPLLVFLSAPRFAEATPRWRYAYPGAWDPDPEALRQFAIAVARRYSGTLADPQQPGVALPRVRYLQAWNEPNLPRYLEPQWVVDHGAWSSFAPRHYREMVNAFYAGVKSVAPGDLVVNAGLAPIGFSAGIGPMTPVAFLRELFCIDVPPATRAVDCADPAHFDAFAFHPLSVGNPDNQASFADDVAVADLDKTGDLMRGALALGTVLPTTPKPLWVTELNWESDPPKTGGVPASLQIAWISRALHRLWVAGAEVVNWQFIVDPLLALPSPLGAMVPVDRPAGLFFRGASGPASDRPKPFFFGFRFPFDPIRRDRRHLLVWAMLPPGPVAPTVLERLRHGRWHPVAVLRAADSGVLNQVVSLSGRARLRLRVGTTTSATASVGTKRFADVRPPRR